MRQSSPPGPRSRFAGLNLLQQIRSDFRAFSHRLHQEYGDAVMYRILGQPVYQFAHPDLAREILISKARSFSKPDNQKKAFGRVIGNNLFTSDGESWTKRRRLLSAMFSPASIDNYRDVITQEIRSELDSLTSGNQNVSVTFSRIALMAVARALFGANMHEFRDSFLSMASELQTSVTRQIQSPVLLPLWFPIRDHRTIKRALRFFHGHLRSLVDDRRRFPGNHTDLLSKLVSATDDANQTLTQQEAVDEALTFLLAGSDTTAAALTWSAYLLARSPQVQQKLRTALRQRQPQSDEEPITDVVQVFREAMRLFPPGVAIARQASEPVQIGDYRLPKGAMAFVSVYTIHHDSRWFEDPDNFRPERYATTDDATDEFTFLSFGAGPRACIGRRLAMMEGQLVLTELLQRFELSLPTPFEEPVLETQLSLHPKGGLVLQLDLL